MLTQALPKSVFITNLPLWLWHIHIGPFDQKKLHRTSGNSWHASRMPTSPTTFRPANHSSSQDDTALPPCASCLSKPHESTAFTTFWTFVYAMNNSLIPSA